MARRSKLDKQIDELGERFTPSIAKAFITAVQGIKDRVVLKEIVDAIDLGNVVRVFNLLGFSKASMAPVFDEIERAFETGGVFVANSAPKLVNKATFLFDVRNSRSEAWIRDNSSTLITRINEEQMTNIATVMTNGLKVGANPRTTALDIIGRYDSVAKKRVGGIIGLTGPQTQFVANMKQELQELDEHYFTRERRDKRFDSIVRKAIDSDTPLDSATIQRLTTRYSDSLLELRGENIGRSEAIEALNKAQMEAFNQAVDSGTVAETAVKKVWDATGDNRTRKDHLEMDGQTVPLNDPFIAPDNSKLMFPGDRSQGASGKETVNCRCKARYVVDWFADID